MGAEVHSVDGLDDEPRQTGRSKMACRFLDRDTRTHYRNRPRDQRQIGNGHQTNDSCTLSWKETAALGGSSVFLK